MPVPGIPSAPILLVFLTAALTPFRQVSAPRTKNGEKPASGGRSETVRAFLDRVHRALVSPEAPRKPVAFQASVRLSHRGPEGQIDIDAEIAFQAPDRLRTVLEEGDRRITRTFDRGRYWMQNGKEVFELQGKTYAKDRASVRRDLALASLLLRYLRPAEALAGLEELRGPSPVLLRQGRRGARKTLRIQGIAADGGRHPLVLSPGHRGPVGIRAWFVEEDLRLLQVELRPLDPKTRKPAGPREVLRFHRHARKSGILIPVEISVLHPDPEGRLRLSQRVLVRNFDLNPPLSPEIFRKPR